MPSFLRMIALGVVLAGLAGPWLNLSAAAALQEKPPARNETSSADAELQADIQTTLDKEPSLSGSGVRANVTGQQIELTGNVARGRDKLTAARIALSYAANRKLVNRIIVTGGSGRTPDAGASYPSGQSPKPQGERTPATNAAPGKVSPPPLP